MMPAVAPGPVVGEDAATPPPGRAPTHEGVLGAIWAALGTVRDPELDEDLVSLRFVGSASVDPEGNARVRLRLPTYFCAPNFAFLMVADSYDAISAVDGVHTLDIALDDHFASEEINGGIAARTRFSDSFEGLADDDLDDLRIQFVRKAVLAGTDRVVRPLLEAGTTPEEIAGMTLADVVQNEDLARLRARRAELGLPAGDDADLVVDPTGECVGIDALPLHLRRARSTRVSIDANGHFCRGVLAQRYSDA